MPPTYLVPLQAGQTPEGGAYGDALAALTAAQLAALVAPFVGGPATPHLISKVLTHADILNLNGAGQGLPFGPAGPDVAVIPINAFSVSSVLGTTPYVGTGANDIQIVDSSDNVPFFNFSSNGLLAFSGKSFQLGVNQNNGSSWNETGINSSLFLSNPGADFTGGDAPDTLSVFLVAYFYNVVTKAFV